MSLRNYIVGENLGMVYVLDDETGVWFMFADVLANIGLFVNVMDVYYKLPEEQKQVKKCTLNNGDTGEFTFIHEEGMYELMKASKSFRMEEFKRWFRDTMETTNGTGNLVEARFDSWE